jgi:hypothetical protein
VPSGEEALSYGETRDLESLESYRLRNVISVQEGDGQTTTVELEIAYTSDPRAEHVIIRNRGEASTEGGDAVELVRIGGDSYARFGDQWMAMQVPEEELFSQSTFIYRPENVFEQAKGRLVGTETVNGIKTKHYVFDKEALSESGLFGTLVEASGELWVSTAHHVVVRAVAHLEGRGPQTDGTMIVDLHSDVRDINADFAIEPPAGVASAQTPEDIPVMPNARDLVVIKQMTSFKVDKSVEEVTSFYKEEMPKNGWQSQASSVPGFLSYKKGDRMVQIAVQSQGDQTGVAIVIPEE